MHNPLIPDLDSMFMKDGPKLQVALDMMNRKRAIQIAKEAVEGGVDVIEAGTPLIKSEGIGIVKDLKRSFPGIPVVADMKTMDVGSFEVEIAAKAGADYVDVLGVADDETISEAVKAGNQYGCKIIVDLINITDKIGRAREVEKLGIDMICVHVGIDQQMRGDNPVESLKNIVANVNIPVSAAGGINSETVPEIVRAGASIIIVGGAIIKAKDVTGAARNVKKAMETGVPERSDLFKKYSHEDVRVAFQKASTPNVADAMHTKGAMKDILPRSNPGLKLIGPALTVVTMDGDWAKPVEAIDQAEPGSVIVIDAGGRKKAVWGELASNSAMENRVEGVVIDGATRDIDSIREMGFPVFSRHVVPDAGEPKGHGEIGLEINAGGQKVRTGDWIIGDDSGVVVVPKEQVTEIANRALDVFERENRLREEIKRGSTLSKVLELERWERVG